MAKYNYKEFASLIGLEARHISTYIKRGSIVADVVTQMIDSTDPTNKLLIEKRKGKQTEKQLVAELAKIGATDNDPDFAGVNIADDTHTARLRELVEKAAADGQDKAGIPGYETSVRLLKYLDTVKRKEEIEFLQLKKDKMKGAMVPSELMQPIIKQHNQSMVTEFKNAGDNFIRVFAQKKAMTGEEMATVKGEFTKIINEAMVKATTMTIKSIAAVINEFAETKSRGERS
ncbi:MAG: hypothetical protein WC756_03700 [Taibaiella sp.]|jgi:hypothetical protein